jgi:hypothetical protein
VYNCNKTFVAECLINSEILLPINLYFSIFILPYLDEQLLGDSFGNYDQTVSDPKNNLTATQSDFNTVGSVERVSPLPKFLGICATISGHDLFASSINKKLGCP